MPDPTFLVIGAQKCGTSWLEHMLRQHPDIFAPKAKELRFFTRKYDKGLDWYRDQFAAHSGEKEIGEFTPNYLWSCSNEQEIKELKLHTNIYEMVHGHYPDLKLIVALRDPVQRAISAYYHFIRSRKIAPNSQIMDVGHTNGILTMGFYAQQIRNWLRFFAPEQFLFLIYEDDIVQNKEKTLKRIFQFLEVDDTFQPANMEKKYNARSGNSYLYLNYYFPKVAPTLGRISLIKQANFPKIEVSGADIEVLSELYRQKNEGLADVIGRVLPWPIVNS